ncbi:zinc-finger domain-containing protein [Vibrio metschnikovii]
MINRQINHLMSHYCLTCFVIEPKPPSFRCS